jgi:uncharacterized protein YjbJ (UPF0337 family)
VGARATPGSLRLNEGIAFARDSARRGKEQQMNWDMIKGNWKQFRGRAKEQWGKLTDDELDQVEGQRDQLVGKIQERYGYAKDQAEREVDDAVRRW